MNAKELRAMKNGMFADRENMDEVLEYATGAFSNDKPMAVTIVMMTFNTLLEGLAKQVEKEDSPVLDVDDVLAWADGTVAALGTEHDDRVTKKEASLAEMIKWWSVKPVWSGVGLASVDYGEMEKRVAAHYAGTETGRFSGGKPNVEEKDRELTHDEAEATYAKTLGEARNGYSVGDKHPSAKSEE